MHFIREVDQESILSFVETQSLSLILLTNKFIIQNYLQKIFDLNTLPWAKLSLWALLWYFQIRIMFVNLYKMKTWHINNYSDNIDSFITMMFYTQL